MSNETNLVHLFALGIFMGIAALYLSPWYTLLRIHIDGDKEDKQTDRYKNARYIAIGEVVFGLLILLGYWINSIEIPWYILDRADPMELFLSSIMSAIGTMIIIAALRSKKMHVGERWFVVTAILCVLMLAWCETLIPWAH